MKKGLQDQIRELHDEIRDVYQLNKPAHAVGWQINIDTVFKKKIISLNDTQVAAINAAASPLLKQHIQDNALTPPSLLKTAFKDYAAQSELNLEFLASGGLPDDLAYVQLKNLQRAIESNNDNYGRIFGGHAKALQTVMDTFRQNTLPRINNILTGLEKTPGMPTQVPNDLDNALHITGRLPEKLFPG